MGSYSQIKKKFQKFFFNFKFLTSDNSRKFLVTCISRCLMFSKNSISPEFLPRAHFQLHPNSKKNPKLLRKLQKRKKGQKNTQLCITFREKIIMNINIKPSLHNNSGWVWVGCQSVIRFFCFLKGAWFVVVRFFFNEKREKGKRR